MIQGALGASPVEEISAAPAAERQLPTFYTKMARADGILILTSKQPEDAAILGARRLIEGMLQSAPRLRQALADAGLRVTVMAANEFTTDVPEHSDLQPKQYWDRRARGLGATRENPVVSCGEENLLHFPGDPYEGESILIHEFAHSVHMVGMARISPGFEAELLDAYHSAKQAGLWDGAYAMTDHKEYFAEGTQSWFDCNASPNRYHNEIRTRKALKKYDPHLAKLLKQAYGDNDWRYEPPAGNQSRGSFADKAKRFSWPPPEKTQEDVAADK